MSQHVRGGSFYKPSPTIELHELHSELRQLIYCIIRKILSMTVTKETIAQIIDNMPIKGNYVGITTYDMIAHPDIETRSQPSSEAIRQAGEVCANIDPMALNVDLRVCSFMCLSCSQILNLLSLLGCRNLRGGEAKGPSKCCFREALPRDRQFFATRYHKHRLRKDSSTS